MKEISKTKDFLLTLCPKWKVEFSDAVNVFWFKQIDENKVDTYFLACVNDPNKRNSDSDIIFKNYFVVDIDIRKDKQEQSWEVLDDFDMFFLIDDIEKAFNEQGYWDWRYLVFSWNWFHFYFVWNWDSYKPEEYKMFVEYHYEKIDKILSEFWLKVDHSCKNIAKIFRLPWTMNYWRKKYWLEPRECEIVKDQEWLICEKFDNFSAIVKLMKNRKVVKEAEYKIKHSMKWIDDPVLDSILNIDIFDLIYELFSIEKKPDNRNLKSPKDWKNVWAFVQENVLYITWTHYFDDSCSWYNPFTFIKVHKNLDNAWTFQWFKDNYPDIQKMSEELKKEYVEQYKEWVVVYDYKKYFMSYDELLKRWMEFRRSINISSVCKYWVKWLDDYIWWILPDELVVIGARSWVGKSELAYNIAVTNAGRNKKVMLFSLEWNIEEPALRHLQREISNKTEIRPVEYRFNTKNIDNLEDEAALRIPQSIKDNLLVFRKDDIPNLNLLKQLIMQAKEDVDLIVIDHLNYIQLNSDNENKEVGEIMRELKRITDIIKKPVILVSHVRKPWSKESEQPPTMYDLYGSSNVAKEATTVIMISKSDLSLTKTLEDWLHRHRYAWTRFAVVKSRSLGKDLVIHWAYDFRKKSYVDSERCLDEDSSVKEAEKIFDV